MPPKISRKRKPRESQSQQALEEIKKKRHTKKWTPEQKQTNDTRDTISRLLENDSATLAYVAGQVAEDGYGGAAVVLTQHTHSGAAEDLKLSLGPDCTIRQAHLLAIHLVLTHVSRADTQFTQEQETTDMKLVDLAILTTSAYAHRVLASTYKWQQSSNRKLIAHVRKAWTECVLHRNVSLHWIGEKSSMPMTKASLLAASATCPTDGSRIQKEALVRERQIDPDATDSEVE